MLNNVEIYFWPVDTKTDRAIVYVFHGDTTYVLHASSDNTFKLYDNLSINLDKTLHTHANEKNINDIYVQPCGFVLCNSTSQLHVLNEHAQSYIEVADTDQCRPSILTTCTGMYAQTLRHELHYALEKYMKKVSVVQTVIRPLNKWVFYNATCITYSV